jgi:hypothetical protein
MLTVAVAFCVFCAFLQNALRSVLLNDRAAGFKIDSCYSILRGGKPIKRGTIGEMVNTLKVICHFIYHQI